MKILPYLSDLNWRSLSLAPGNAFNTESDLYINSNLFKVSLT